MENRTAIYLRLSRDDEKHQDSESIINQRSFLIKYAKNNGLNVVKILSDDGYSGLDFERPAFKKLLALIEQKEIDTVLTKDLSRLGRDYIMTGYYLEQYFPSRRVRYIAANDNIDTHKDFEDDFTPFRAVFNDMYAKDISKKVRSALDTKKLDGKFIGSKAPYGYKKDIYDKNHLVIDEKTGYIVKKIFELFLGGKSIYDIAKHLTDLKIPTPSESAESKSVSNKSWNATTVRHILSHPTYMGNITQNMSRKINYKLKQRLYLPKEEWISIENTHEALVSACDFYSVEKLLKKRTYNKTNRKGKTHLLSGIVYCKECGAKMSFMRQTETRTYVICSNWRKGGEQKQCSSHSIREDFVECVLKEKLWDIFATINTDRIITALNNMTNKADEEAILSLKSKIKMQSDMLFCLYKDKTERIISERDYIEMSKKINDERNACENAVMMLYNKIKKGDKADNRLDELLCIEKMTNHMAKMLVEKIIIGKDKSIEITFAFKKPDKL